MKIKLVVVGKTKKNELITLINDYLKRINFYIKFNIVEVTSLKSKKINEKELKKIEGENILKNIEKNEVLFLLDENGKSFNSVDFSKFIENKIQQNKNIAFAIGGAYGFSKEVYEKSSQTISISKMTFSHQIARLFFTEQLFRAFTIINNHPYHND
ncbi:MAG: 23S rRNA (pseudouridine(1915)-N(3))-methyltransferase RlmH [Flavobacteriaceae bacterium]|jgi:23S rRNA (pseudouridine1915-N3)-methyltransferase